MNWTSTNKTPYLKSDAEKALKKVKDRNKGRQTKLVKVSDKPLTYKEVFC